MSQGCLLFSFNCFKFMCVVCFLWLYLIWLQIVVNSFFSWVQFYLELTLWYFKLTMLVLASSNITHYPSILLMPSLQEFIVSSYRLVKYWHMRVAKHSFQFAVNSKRLTCNTACLLKYWVYVLNLRAKVFICNL